PVVNNTPRGDLALKKSPGKVSVLVNAAGTPSQLISRRPAGCSSRVAPLSGSPSRTRYCATAAAMAALSPLALTTCACPFFSRVFLAASGGAGAITRWPVSLQAAKSSAPSAALQVRVVCRMPSLLSWVRVVYGLEFVAGPRGGHVLSVERNRWR